MASETPLYKYIKEEILLLEKKRCFLKNNVWKWSFWDVIFCLQTGKSKGYAFIEFDCDEVAKIVAETMNNYLMGERLIKCKYLLDKSEHYFSEIVLRCIYPTCNNIRQPAGGVQGTIHEAFKSAGKLGAEGNRHVRAPYRYIFLINFSLA